MIDPLRDGSVTAEAYTPPKRETQGRKWDPQATVKRDASADPPGGAFSSARAPCARLTLRPRVKSSLSATPSKGEQWRFGVHLYAPKILL